jgi:hypothetical protein
LVSAGTVVGAAQVLAAPADGFVLTVIVPAPPTATHKPLDGQETAVNACAAPVARGTQVLLELGAVLITAFGLAVPSTATQS